MTMSPAFELVEPVNGWCPVQAFGRIGEYSWYFRARGSGWTLDIGAECTDLPGYVDDFGAVWSCCAGVGDGPYSAGWMSHRLARSAVAGALMLYLEGHPGGDLGDADPADYEHDKVF